MEKEHNKQSKVQMIIRKCLFQNSQFNQWNLSKQYNKFHSNHYDWWAFPVNTPSSYGSKFQVDIQDKIKFMNNHQFIMALRSNSILVCLSWGYDLVKGEEIQVKTKDQKWQNWPIRLYKMANSLQYFQQLDLHEKAIRFGCSLLNKGYQLRYKKDLSAYFMRCNSNYCKKKECNLGQKSNELGVGKQIFINSNFKKVQEEENHIKQNIHVSPYRQNQKFEKEENVIIHQK